MGLFVVIVLGPACLFLLYVLLQFWREAMLSRAEEAKHRAAAVRLLEGSVHGSEACFQRPDDASRRTGNPAKRTEHGSRGVLTFRSAVKHSTGGGTV